MNFYKITNETETHHDLTYRDGLNIDSVPFSTFWDLQPKGIYFSREDIFAFLNGIGWTGKYIRRVTLPDDARVYENPGFPKCWKADRIILGPRRELTVEVFRELLEEGANVHAGDDFALRWAAGNGDIKTAKLLLENGANVHVGYESVLISAVENDDIDVVKLSLEYGADIHAQEEYALHRTITNGSVAMARFLLEHGANLQMDSDHLLQWAALLSECAAGVFSKQKE